MIVAEILVALLLTVLVIRAVHRRSHSTDEAPVISVAHTQAGDTYLPEVTPDPRFSHGQTPHYTNASQQVTLRLVSPRSRVYRRLLQELEEGEELIRATRLHWRLLLPVVATMLAAGGCMVGAAVLHSTSVASLSGSAHEATATPTATAHPKRKRAAKAKKHSSSRATRNKAKRAAAKRKKEAEAKKLALAEDSRTPLWWVPLLVVPVCFIGGWFGWKAWAWPVWGVTNLRIIRAVYPPRRLPLASDLTDPTELALVTGATLIRRFREKIWGSGCGKVFVKTRQDDSEDEQLHDIGPLPDAKGFWKDVERVRPRVRRQAAIQDK